MTRGKPSYDLEEVKQRVGGGAYVITLQARKDAYRLGLDAADVRDCILGLTASDFYKSMESKRLPDQRQDVYHAGYSGLDLYLKLQMRESGPVIVISFKLL